MGKLISVLVRFAVTYQKRLRREGQTPPDVGFGIPMLLSGLFWLYLRYGIDLFAGNRLTAPGIRELLVTIFWFISAGILTYRKIDEWSWDRARSKAYSYPAKKRKTHLSVHDISGKLRILKLKLAGWSKEEIEEYRLKNHGNSDLWE